MSGFIHRVGQNFIEFYADPAQYALPQIVDLEGNLDKYSIKSKKPEEYLKIKGVLDRTLKDTSTIDFQLKKISRFSKKFNKVIHLLKEAQFTLIKGGAKNNVGLIAEHPDFSNWILKQNFSGNKNSSIIEKSVYSNDAPFWLFPSKWWPSMILNPKALRGISARNETLNPLRVEMMRRGRQCIKKLGLTHIKATQEFLYPLKSGEGETELHQKYVVLSKKSDILDEQENLEKFGDLGLYNPAKLEKIVEELCQFIIHTHITDMHLHNVRFLKDKDILMAIDGEPIGGLKDISQKDINYSNYDYALFPLLGLSKLKESVGLLKKNKICEKKANAVKAIFDRVINKKMSEIILERQLYYGKFIVSVICPVIPLVYLIAAIFKTLLGSKK